MQRILVFSGAGFQNKFDKVWEGFVGGSRAEQQHRQAAGQRTTSDEQRRRADVMRKLKKASSEDKERPIAAGICYRSVLEGTELVLTQPEHKMLVETLEAAEWNPELLDEAYDVIDWVSSAEKKENQLKDA